MRLLTPRVIFGARFKVEAYDAMGRPKWTDYTHNLVTNVGLDDLLDKYLKGSSYSAAWYVGLISATPTVAAADTMSSHAGWTEVEDYDEATREALTLGSVSGQNVDNSASPAEFTIDATVTVGGIFVASNNTKGGTTGILLSAAAFSGGNRAVVDNDILRVTVDYSAADA